MSLRFLRTHAPGSMLLAGSLFFALSSSCSDPDDSGLGPEDAGAETDSETGACGFSSAVVVPADKATLTAADDTSGKKCAEGLVTTVKVATSAPDGTAAKLFANDAQVANATVSGAQVVFANVSLPSKGSVALKVQLGTDASCVATNSITVDCGVPLCQIAKPKGPYLNGRPTADGGDRVNGASDPFATAVEVTTDIEDGQTVTLSVDGTDPLKATASGGVAKFDKVTMSPDGVHTLGASCKSASGNVGGSGAVSYTVLTAPVDLTVTSPTATKKTFGIADDIDTATAGIQFKVCGSTTTANAIDVPADARLGQKNFCATAGAGTSVCDSMKSAGACVTVTCPSGSAPFDVKATLADKAGNLATTTLTGISCESNLPSVRVVSPVKYEASTPSTILNLSKGEAGSASGLLKKTVVACTDKAGAKAQLFVGSTGSTLTALGAPVTVSAAVTADGCPTGFAYVAKFTGVTLPESLEKKDGTGALLTTTQIRVDVTDVAANVGSSPAVDLWVDSVPPALLLTSPACGKAYSSTVDVTDTGVVLSDTLPFTFKVAGSATTGTYPVTAFDAAPTVLPAQATIPNVKFYVGGNTLTLTATDAAGNTTDALPSCKTYVGTPPVIAIGAPTDGQKFVFDSNVDLATYKYKTNITGTVTGTTTATTVSLSFGGTSAGTAPISGGAFTFSSALIPEGDAVPVTVSLVDSVYGTVSKSVTVVVDTHVPTLTGALSASVDAATRRAGGVALSWTKGTDYDPATGTASRACDHYELRRSNSAITNETQYAAATVVDSSIGGLLGSVTKATGRLPSNLFFALKCFDRSGNASALIGSSSAVSLDYLANSLTSTLTDFGRAASSYGDFNGDGRPDLVVGTLDGKVEIHFAHAPTSATDSGYNNTDVLTVIGGAYFGATLAVLPDFDGDKVPDLAVSEIPSHKVYVISGKALGATGTAAVSSLGTNVLTIAGDGTAAGFLGLSLASIGNFDGDSGAKSDLALRALFSSVQTVAVISGRTIDGTTLNLPGGASNVIKSKYSSGSQFGNSFAAQDLDGDGLADLVIGDNLKDAAYVFKGRAASSTALSEDNANGSLVGTAGSFFGYSVSLPGPMGSGASHLLVGAYTGTGKVDVAGFSGLVPSVATTITNPTSAAGFGVVLIDLPAGKRFDLDKDGIADSLACDRVTSGGKCYLHYGASPSSSPGWTTANAPKTFTYTPASSTDGRATLIGDVDGDGFDDFAICSPGTKSCLIIR